MDRLLLGRGEKASIVARPSRGDEASEEGHAKPTAHATSSIAQDDETSLTHWQGGSPPILGNTRIQIRRVQMADAK